MLNKLILYRDNLLISVNSSINDSKIIKYDELINIFRTGNSSSITNKDFLYIIQSLNKISSQSMYNMNKDISDRKETIREINKEINELKDDNNSKINNINNLLDNLSKNTEKLDELIDKFEKMSNTSFIEKTILGIIGIIFGVNFTNFAELREKLKILLKTSYDYITDIKVLKYLGYLLIIISIVVTIIWFLEKIIFIGNNIKKLFKETNQTQIPKPLQPTKYIYKTKNYPSWLRPR